MAEIDDALANDTGLQALDYLQALLLDEKTPEYLKNPFFRGAVESWARAEAMARTVSTYLIANKDADPASMAALAESARKLELYALKCRRNLGLTPASYADIRRKLNLGPAGD